MLPIGSRASSSVGLFGEHLGIGDMVAIAVLLVAIDDDAKHVEDGIAMAVEATACHGEPATHLGLHLMVVELLEGEALMAVDGVDEPDVFFEEGSGAHGCRSFYSLANIQTNEREI